MKKIHIFQAGMMTAFFMMLSSWLTCMPKLNVEYRTFVPYWETWDSRTPYENLPSPWDRHWLESATAIITDKVSWSTPYSMKITHGASQSAEEEIHLPIERGIPDITISHRIMCPDSGSGPSPAIYLSTEQSFNGPFTDIAGAWIINNTLVCDTASGLSYISVTGMTDGQWLHLVFRADMETQTCDIEANSTNVIEGAGFLHPCTDVSRIIYRLHEPPDSSAETVLFVDNVSIYTE